MRYRVTQFSTCCGYVHHKVYRSRLHARIIAWLVSGRGSFLTQHERFYTKITEEA